MRGPIRVAHVMGHMGSGGVESTVINHYRHVDRDRVQFDFIVNAGSPLTQKEEIEDLGGRVFVVPGYKALPAYLKACRSLFKREQYAIVHSNVNALSVFPLRAARDAGVPVRIAHSHSTADPDERAKTVAKNVLRRFSRTYPTHYAACSNHAARWLFGDQLVDAGRVHVIHNALDLDSFAFNADSRCAIRGKLAVDDSCLVLGQVGRLCPQKNQLFTLKAFAELHKVRPNSLLVLVGGGEQDDEVRPEIGRLGLSGAVRLTGVRQNVGDFYSAFDALLLPSLYEGLGMVAVEAQVSGLPVFASDRVPSESVVCPDLVRFLGIDEPHDWATSLAEYQPPQERLSRAAEISRCGYDINDSAEALCCWYEQLAATVLH